jgi:hypothetical protein
MNKLENFYQLLSTLKYGKYNALTAEKLAKIFHSQSISDVKRKLRQFAQEARLNGHWVIGDDSGYYIALTKEEWLAYRQKRFNAINSELQALAACDKISFGDLIKNVYAISVDDKNYTLF